MQNPDEILSFWLDEVGPEGWYKVEDALDESIRSRFGAAWEEARDGGFTQWLTYPTGALAYLILVDQFPRNMFRGQGTAFATDRLALAAAKSSIERGWDLRTDAPARQFFYLPLMHSENLCDQDRCVRLVCERMPQQGGSTLTHARAHRSVIRQFGRFPYRNDALDRTTTGQERAFMQEGGYAQALRGVQAAAKAA